MRNNEEAKIQIALCNYIRMRYPNVIFNCDLSGVNLSMSAAKQAKLMRSSKGFPDMVIYEPRMEYKGLFIELKKDCEKLLKKDGSFLNEHIFEQYNMILELNKRGYLAMFCIGFDKAKDAIDQYLS